MTTAADLAAASLKVAQINAAIDAVEGLLSKLGEMRVEAKRERAEVYSTLEPEEKNRLIADGPGVAVIQAAVDQAAAIGVRPTT